MADTKTTTRAHTVPDLGYAFDALEPHIDAKTMEIHHDKHHQAYVDKLNAAIADQPELHGMSPDDLMRNLNRVPEHIRTAVRNNGGGHANHSFFWPLLKKGTKLGGPIADAINEKFGSFDKFKEQFANAAKNQFGSGWAWLVLGDNGLEVTSTPNQDTPLMTGKTPLLGLDVWEHAYYLKYQNRRPDYVEAFFSVINWDQVNENYKNAKK